MPGPLYCDTSALLKLFFAEPGSAELTRVVHERDDVLISDLSVTEVVSALSRRVRDGVVSQDDARRVHGMLMASLESAPYQRVELTRDVHRRAEHILMTLARPALRMSDALHLALAECGRAASIASFDRRVTGAARVVGLAVYPA